MEPPLRTRRAQDRRQDRSKAPCPHICRFGKHYRAGLQPPERVSIVRNQGSEFSGQSMEQSRATAAKRVRADKPTAQPRGQRSRLTSNVKGPFAKDHLPKRPTARSRATARRGHLPAWPGLRAKNRPGRTALLSRAAPACVSNSVRRVARPLARPRA